jgi:DNA replication initiation complex subunit (GINS family)
MEKGVQIPGQISELQSDFYPRLRRFLVEQKEQATQTQQAEKFQEYDRTRQLARDIVNSRLKKIVALSAAPAQSDQILNKLTTEEKILYNQLVKLISQWKAKILQMEQISSDAGSCRTYSTVPRVLQKREVPPTHSAASHQRQELFDD